jgi:spore germination protein KA
MFYQHTKTRKFIGRVYMSGYFRRIMFYLKQKSASEKKYEDSGENAEDGATIFISNMLDKNLEVLKNIFGGSVDIVFREFRFGRNTQTRAALLYIDGLVDKDLINQSLLQPLMYDSRFFAEDEEYGKTLEGIEDSLLSLGDLSKSGEVKKLTGSVVSGDTALLIDGFDKAFIISTRKWEQRGVPEPQTEVGVRGPREGFTESLRISTSLLRRKIKNPDLIFESMTIGRRTHTDICIAYIRGIAPEHVLKELRKRLSSIDIDSILESGNIEHLIRDAPYSIFAIVGVTERPDVAATRLLEGRAAVIVDGTPFILTVPSLFIESFQVAEDYYMNFIFASTLRLIRFLSYAITILVPSIYVAILTYHPEMIPTPLLFTLAASEEGLPLPIGLEVFLMLTVFEILREAGIRLPRAVGSAISIVGALVLGQAAVAAGLVSDFTVIIVGITAVSSFVVTTQTDSASALRFIFYIFAAFLGGFGIVMGILGVIVRISTLRSFGVPYFSPLAPYIPEDMKDVFVRYPLWKMNMRPKSLEPQDMKRQADNQKPGVNKNEA